MKAIFKILGCPPLVFRIFIGRVLGSIFSFVPTRDSKIARLQLKVFLPTEPTGKIHRLVYANLGQTFFETLNLKPLLDREECIEFDNWELVELLRKDNKGFIVLTAHLANWDLLAAYFTKHKLPLSTIAKKTRNSGLHKVITDIRSDYGIKSIWRDKVTGGARDIIKDIKDGRGVAALIDQDTRVKCEMVDFFGTPASTPSTLVSLAKKMDVPLVSAFIIRRSNYRYVIEAQQLDKDRSDIEILQEFNRRLENLVRLSPSQWVWLHKRWRTGKSGVRMSSKDYLQHLQNILEARL